MPSFCAHVSDERVLCNEQLVAAWLPDYAAICGMWWIGLTTAGYRTLGKQGLRISLWHLPVTTLGVALTFTAHETRIGIRLVGFSACVLDALVHATRLQFATSRFGVSQERAWVTRLMLAFTLVAGVPALLGALALASVI